MSEIESAILPNKEGVVTRHMSSIKTILIPRILDNKQAGNATPAPVVITIFGFFLKKIPKVCISVIIKKKKFL